MLEEERPFDKPRTDGISYGRLPSLRRRRFRLVAAEVDVRAAPAFGGARLASVAAVGAQQVVRAAAEGMRRWRVAVFFVRENCRGWGEAGSVAVWDGGGVA